jgi:hypothetical protein
MGEGVQRKDKHALEQRRIPQLDAHLYHVAIESAGRLGAVRGRRGQIK